METSSSFNIFTLYNIIKRHKKTYVKAICITFILGCIYVFSVPKEYTSSTIIAPEYSSGASLGSLSNLASMASMVGMNIGNIGADEDAIGANLYPDIAKTSPFIQELLAQNVTTEEGENMTLREYYTDHQTTVWWSYPFEWLKKIKKGKEDGEGIASIYDISKDEEELIKAVANSLLIVQDNTTGLITISATSEDPLVSAIVADSVSSALRSYIYDYRTKKAASDLAYIQKLRNQAKEEYEKKSAIYTRLADENHGNLLARVSRQVEDAEQEMQLCFEAYSQLKQQEVAASAKLQNRAPVFSVMQPPMKPTRKSAPKRMIIVAFLEIMACFSLTIYYLVKEQRNA